MELEPEPLPRKLVEKAKAQGVVKINVCWSGGSDEGHCEVNLEYTKEADSDFAKSLLTQRPITRDELEPEFEEWAEESFDYSGAGDGSAYGDDLVYDLEKNTVQCSDWYMVREDGGEVVLELQTEGGKDEENDLSQC
tara:strand:+ start:2775 stop:3185 length:411 start_codon:yes stop_codon:yes gene_type:complete